MGSGDADSMLLCSSGMKGCPPQVSGFSLQNLIVRHCSCTTQIVISHYGKKIH